MNQFFCHLEKSFQDNGIILTAIVYWRKFINKLYNCLVVGRHDTHVDSRARIFGLSNIKLGKNFSSERGLWLEAVTEYNGEKLNSQIIIGDDVSFSEFNHIGAAHYIKIGNHVLFGSKCYITDHNHGIYKGIHQSSVDTFPIERNLPTDGFVIIEDNVWVGDNVVIVPNVKIGYGAIIGANSVVTKDVPPYTICVGIPAKPIKKWDFEKAVWVKIKD